MKSRLAPVALVICTVCCLASAVLVYRTTQGNHQVVWYNAEFRKQFGDKPGGMTFNMGTKLYELGIRQDGVVIAREVDPKKPSAN